MDSPSSTDSELRTRFHQQEVVADLGQLALETDDLDRLMHEVTAVIAETLDTDYCHVLELLPEAEELVLSQGVGWHDGIVGNATIPTATDSQAGYTLLSREPIIVDDLPTEDRFVGNDLLVDHNVTSGITVIIGSVEEPWGVLGTFTTEQRMFTEHDANFIQSIANVLASAIENEEAQSELEEIYGRISDAFFALDEDWNFTYLNECAHEMINPEDRELAGQNIWEEFPAAVEREFKPKYERAMYEQETVSFEEYYPEPLDAWFEVRAYPSETGLSVYFRDVSERKEREQELELFQNLLNHSSDAVFVIDPDTAVLLDINDTACRRLGYDKDELLDLSIPDIETGLPDLDAWRAHVEEVRAKDGVTFEGEHRRADGSTFPVEVNVVHASFDQEYIFAVARDITERRERERKLIESEKRYRTLAESFPNGIVTMFNDDLRYTLAAGQAFEDLPVSQDDIEDRTPREVWGDDVADTLEPLLQATLHGEENSVELSYAGRKWVVHAVPITDEDGHIFAGMTMGQDITRRKEREQRLEELVDRLKESNERLEQFAYAASHDLQEPLRMVSSYLSLIEDRYGDALDEDGEEFLAFAVDGAERMREMIDALLEYSRVETHGDPFEPVHLEDVLADVLQDLQVQIEESDAEVVTDDLPRVEGDASQLRQVFQNLLDNAIEYSGEEPPQIHVGADRDGDEWVIPVSDEGIGIDPDHADRVFEVFQRLHTQDKHAGTGIGLALCKRIVERHGGEIWVDSAPGEGATFSFTLPVASGHDI